MFVLSGVVGVCLDRVWIGDIKGVSGVSFGGVRRCPASPRGAGV